MYDIIEKKKQGTELSDEEIRYFVSGYTNDDIPDYQMSALMMAIFFQGMNERETTALTVAMADSGDKVDLSPIKGVKVDKHSTGGVGDKTTFIIIPIVASLGVKAAKMSGRGLGFTGGTIDKMESVKGLKTVLNRDKFFDTVNKVGMSIIGQSGNLTPADKKMYALRDVTATVNSIPLIASSIMSKKLAAGSDCILLDVKTGDGAFMKTTEDSIKLAQTMVKIGENAGRKTIALITDMNNPLGNNIGNALEMQEVFDTLKGKGPDDLNYICKELAANMLFMAQKGSLDTCRSLAKQQIQNGEALKKLGDMIKAQGGDPEYINDYSKFEHSKVTYSIKMPVSGYIHSMRAEQYGTASIILGAGRNIKSDPIDYSAGIVLNKKNSEYISAGETLAVLHSCDINKCKQAEKLILNATLIKNTKPKNTPVIKARITNDGIERFDIE